MARSFARKSRTPFDDDDYASCRVPLGRNWKIAIPICILWVAMECTTINNQDHAMMTATLCAENTLANKSTLRSLVGRRRCRIARGRPRCERGNFGRTIRFTRSDPCCRRSRTGARRLSQGAVGDFGHLIV